MARLQTNTRMAISRKGFTLIELLIVILIIAILATLVTLGVSNAIRFSKRVATKTEMAQIEQALGVAATEMGRVPFIPSYVILFEKPSDYDSYTGSDKAYANMSRRILTQMFPKWTLASWKATKLDATKAYIFFLRGRDGNGFSTGPDPWAPPDTKFPATLKRLGPYYEFKVDRLDETSNGFALGYKDYWDNPGSYLTVYSQMMIGQNKPPVDGNGIVVETPAGYPGRLLQKPDKYFMPRGYQILSAGKDGKWGTYPNSLNGQVFSGGGPGFMTGQPGEDDQSNFAEDVHGKPIDQ